MHQWAIVAETTTSAELGGACDYATTTPRPPPHHACVNSASMAARSMAHNLYDTGVDIPSVAQPSAEYIADMIVEYTPSRHLRSAGSRLLRVPRHNLEHYGRRGFSVTAPRL